MSSQVQAEEIILKMEGKDTSFPQAHKMDKKLGYKRKLSQITDTITFELNRGRRKTISMLLFTSVIFFLMYLLDIIMEAGGVDLPETATDFVVSYFGIFDLLAIIVVIAFGNSIIVGDFSKDTGNLLFPKITKERLLIGRFIALYGLSALIISYYYGLLAFGTFMLYETVPELMLESLFWALLYTFMLFCFVTLSSAIMKSAATSIVFTVIILLTVSSIILQVLAMTTEAEPLFLMNYYVRIVSACFDMPKERFIQSDVGTNITLTTWLTPSREDALFGMLIHSAIFLVLAYIVYKKKQN